MVGIKGEEPVKRGQVYFLSHGVIVIMLMSAKN